MFSFWAAFGHTCLGRQRPFLSSRSQFYMGFPKSSYGVQAPLLPLTSIFHPSWHRPWSRAATVQTRGYEALKPALMVFAHGGLHSSFW